MHLMEDVVQGRAADGPRDTRLVPTSEEEHAGRAHLLQNRAVAGIRLLAQGQDLHSGKAQALEDRLVGAADLARGAGRRGHDDQPTAAPLGHAGHQTQDATMPRLPFAATNGHEGTGFR